MSLNLLVVSINEGFGETLGKIGLIIIFGVIIGAFLENSGGAYALAEKVLMLVGKKRVSSAMSAIGYIVSIPVFADSGFLLLSPLNKSLSKKAGISLSGPAVALGLGLTATHTRANRGCRDFGSRSWSGNAFGSSDQCLGFIDGSIIC